MMWGLLTRCARAFVPVPQSNVAGTSYRQWFVDEVRLLLLSNHDSGKESEREKEGGSIIVRERKWE